MIFLNTQFSVGAIIAWIIIGFVAGAVVYGLDRREVKGGLIGTLLAGILGGVIGGFLTSLFWGVVGFDIRALLISAAGGLLLAWFERGMASETSSGVLPRQAYYSEIPWSAGRERRRSAPRRKKTLPRVEDIEEYLGGVEYPATKDDLLYEADREGADDEVLYAIGQLPDKEYRSSLEVGKELGRLE